ncbi:MAG: CRISPR-associated protein [Nostocaceae cyanobacterium]|nr:CRISPR-associated protein [Nostocaceae cyanobacterium]
MPRFVISTVGTSLLTNQIDNQFESDWLAILEETANFTQAQINNHDSDIAKNIDDLKQRAEKALEEGNTLAVRKSSAELNGIYGLYKDNIHLGKEDIHWLIATDTAQGQITAKILEEFLKNQGLTNISIYTPPGLSTATTQKFSEGIDELLVWLRNQIIHLRERYKIYFNLVGSFKSLQGYLNTIGMFYADEIIYIFEGKLSELITIPRLPIRVDESAIKPHAVKLALMDAGAGLSSSEVTNIPEALIGDCGGKKVLSTWGQLIWNECKEELLSKDLLTFPRLQYADTFRADYNKIKNEQQKKVELQQDLAKVSCLLIKSDGDTSVLKEHPGFRYDKYTNKGDIAHFRVNQGWRISCTSSQGVLTLRHYGKEPDVNKNP